MSRADTVVDITLPRQIYWMIKMRKWSLFALAALLVLGALILIGLRSVNQTYKYAVTRQHMVIMGESLKEYRQKKGVLTVDARQYLVSEGFSVTDEWGYPYLIEATTDQFSITSLGSDHEVGGVGYATDIIVRWQRGAESLTVISADIHP